jgi:hypothetical protein
MVHHVDLCITEAAKVATEVEFEVEEAARDKLRLSTGMKGGGIVRTTNTRYPTYLAGMY